MKVDLCFKGWLRGVELDDVQVTNVLGMTMYVDHLPTRALADMLNKSEAFVSLVDVLDRADDSSIELFDFEVVE